ncbi:MAG TPA: hypothetical protein VK400_14785 [Pyrinomonadaceae bacterium]|nr:hypothetical protein [Pyrinomonadaceae bacterium]
MKLNKLVLLVFVLGLAASSAFAQKTWEKPFQQWDKESALKILDGSPWAQSYQSAQGTAAAERAQSTLEQSDQRLGRAEWGRTARQMAPQPIVIRLQSGLPLRQALVRLQQIEAGYDKMSEEKRAQYDARTKEFLDCPICKNYYVVTLTKYRKSSSEGVDDGMFQTLRLEDLKGNIQLVNDKGEQRQLAHFIAPTRAGESAVLFFPRKDGKGNILLTPENQSFKLAFNNTFLEDPKNPYGSLLQRNFEFKVSKLIVNNELLF